MKTLVADDDLTSRRTLEAVLRKWGYEVLSVRDGDEAWAALQAQDAPRLAILDWMMPGADGVEICRRLRAKQPTDEHYIYVILVTARSAKEEIVEGMESGADDYIVKPFDPQELRVRIRAGERIVRLQTELVAAKEALRIQATHDALTGILNRRAILERLEAELSRARRENRPLTVAMIDLDHFKQVNDTLGHEAGDVVLRESVRRIRSILREYDSVGRYGGEEFLVVLPGVDSIAAKSVLERVRTAVAEHTIRIAEKEIRVTVSLGAATCDGSAVAEDLIRAADAALYQAKTNGRNRVEYAAPIIKDSELRNLAIARVEAQ